MVRRMMVGLALTLTLVGCASTQPDMPALAPTQDTTDAVARITFPTGGEDFVSRAEFEQARDKLLQGAPEEFVLDYLASRHMILRDARGKDVTADAQEVDTLVNNIATQTCPQLPIPEAQSNTDPEALLEACANFFGFDGAAGMRRYLQEEIIVNKVIEQEAQSEEIHAAHILVATEAEAQAARERVTTGGEDFNTVAQEISTEPAAKESGGDLGFFGPGAMVPEFDQAVFALKDGEISQPVQTQFGWHVIKAIERRPAEQPSPAVANQYREQLVAQAKADGRLEYLITPAPPPTQAAPPMELPTVEVDPNATNPPAVEIPEETSVPEVEPEPTEAPEVEPTVAPEPTTAPETEATPAPEATTSQ